jgi:DNA invertase Pin-like site-specific DNA recombinase
VKLGDVAAGSVLLVESLDRKSRKEARKAVRVLAEIVEAGVDVVTLGDGEKRYTKDSLNGFDFIMAVLILMRANEESRTKGRRVAQAWAAKRARQAKSGETLTRLTPGWVDVTAAGKRVLIPERAAVVRRIFELFAKGGGCESIARTLNEEKVSRFGRAAHWHKSYIHKILRSSTVIGTMIPHTDDSTTRTPQAPVVGYFPLAVSRELWERAQALIETNRSRRPAASTLKTQNVLAGLARCPACGGTMTRVYKGAGRKGGNPKLVCVAAKLGTGCKYVSVDLPLIEAALMRTARDPVPEPGEGLAEELRGAQAGAEALDDVIQSLTDSIEKNPSKALMERLKAREAARDRAWETVAELTKRAAESETRTLRRRKLAYRTAMTAKPFDAGAANLALREMVSKIVVDHTRQALQMHWRHDGVTEIVYTV